MQINFQGKGGEKIRESSLRKKFNENKYAEKFLEIMLAGKVRENKFRGNFLEKSFREYFVKINSPVNIERISYRENLVKKRLRENLLREYQFREKSLRAKSEIYFGLKEKNS